MSRFFSSTMIIQLFWLSDDRFRLAKRQRYPMKEFNNFDLMWNELCRKLRRADEAVFIQGFKSNCRIDLRDRHYWLEKNFAPLFRPIRSNHVLNERRIITLIIDWLITLVIRLQKLLCHLLLRHHAFYLITYPKYF